MGEDPHIKNRSELPLPVVAHAVQQFFFALHVQLNEVREHERIQTKRGWWRWAGGGFYHMAKPSSTAIEQPTPTPSG
jgi:hypothetical protein